MEERKRPNSKVGNKKISLLLVLRALEQSTNKMNPVKQVELAQMVNDVGAELNIDVWCDRKTVGRHLKLLAAAGYDIRKVSGKGVYLERPEFTVKECRVLMAVVNDSPKLTDKQKKYLSGKLDKQQQLLDKKKLIAELKN